MAGGNRRRSMRRRPSFSMTTPTTSRSYKGGGIRCVLLPKSVLHAGVREVYLRGWARESHRWKAASPEKSGDIDLDMVAVVRKRSIMPILAVAGEA